MCSLTSKPTMALRPPAVAAALSSTFRGKVIGINQAILENLPGSNFGISVRFALELIKEQ